MKIKSFLAKPFANYIYRQIKKEMATAVEDQQGIFNHLIRIGTKTSFGKDVVNFMGNYTPFLSSAWPVRTAYSRVWMDELRSLIDPQAEVKDRRAQRKMMKEYGNSSYWQPGDNLPGRMPDFSNALGSRN